LAAGIRRVKGVKKIGVRLGNWLTPEQSERLWKAPDCQVLKGKRDRALLAVQQREDHWSIVVKTLLDEWIQGKLGRRTDGKSSLARRPGARPQSRYRATGAAR